MTTHHYATRLHQAICAKRTPSLVGLDPRWNSLPPAVISAAEARGGTQSEIVASAFEEFCCGLVDVIAPLVAVVKPQAAFFEQWGPAGSAALANVIRYARKAGLLVICDAKRGDIGSTATAYAEGYLAGANLEAAIWAADALTVSPYLGADTLEPFVQIAQERGAGIYVLVRTSNPGAGTFQDRETDGKTLYECVADTVERLAIETADDGGYGCVGAVVGATYPAELAALREKMPHAPLLVPGYGSQGAGAADTAAAFDDAGLGAVINSSRAINFAFSKEPFAEQFGPDQWQDAASAATRQMIDDLAGHTSAQQLQAS